jgi:hypothetical protein
MSAITKGEAMIRGRVVQKLVVGFFLAAASWACTAANDLVEPSSVPASPGVVGDLANRVRNLNLLRCDPLPYQKSVKTIGPAGGTITVGKHALVVPAGALRSDTRITAEAISDGRNTVRFSPEGLQFRRTTRLMLDYSNCPLVRLVPVLRKVVYTDERLSILEVLKSLDHPRQMKVEGDVDHFSRYAVAW